MVLTVRWPVAATGSPGELTPRSRMPAKKTPPAASTADTAAAKRAPAVKSAPSKPAPAAPVAKGKAATKPAAKKAAAAKAPPELDLAEELEFEAAAEAEVAEAGAKAKPLRVKVPKSKERALIREFGLDVTTLTEEEVEKRRSELKALVKMGKSRGFLTQQEINDHLPEKLVDAEVLEATVKMLNDMGIAVYEQAPDAATLLVAGGAGAAATDDEAEEAAEAAVSTVDSEFGRTTDPVRMYMREMGSFELLTREGEIEIAKRIEGGLQAMMLAISALRRRSWPSSWPTATRIAAGRAGHLGGRRRLRRRRRGRRLRGRGRRRLLR